jgi:hypothetical protein
VVDCKVVNIQRAQYGAMNPAGDAVDGNGKEGDSKDRPLRGRDMCKGVSTLVQHKPIKWVVLKLDTPDTGQLQDRAFGCRVYSVRKDRMTTKFPCLKCKVGLCINP